MADETRNLTFVVKAKDDASAVFGKVQSSYAQLRKDLEKSEARAAINAKPVGFFDQLKGFSGRGSVLKETTELLAGGGVIAGVTIIGRQIADFTALTIKWRDALREGKAEIGGIAEEAAKAIPVFGAWWQVGRNIREMITGEAAADNEFLALDKQRLAEAEKRRDEMKRRREQADKSRTEFNNLLADSARQHQQNQREEQLANAPDEFERRRLQAQFGALDRETAAREKFNSILAGTPEQQKAQVRERLNGIIDEIGRDYADAVKRIANEKSESEQKRIAAETEDRLRQRRQMEQEQISEAQRQRNDDARALEAARITGRATSAQAGLISGVGRPGQGGVERTLTASEKHLKNIEDALKNRRAIELAASTG